MKSRLLIKHSSLFTSLMLLLGITAQSAAGGSDIQDEHSFTASTQDIQFFIAAFNKTLPATSERYFLKLLHVKPNDGFVAYKCWTPNCIESEDSLLETRFRLFLADINNDGIQDFTLVQEGRGGEDDQVEGVYNVQSDRIYSLPYDQSIVNALGKDKIKNWPAFIGMPFITKTQDRFFLHFIDHPEYKDANGKKVHAPHSIQASVVETSHYTYQWQGEEIKLTTVTTETKHLDQSGP